MNKRLINPAPLVITLIIGIVYGIIIHKYEVIPYQIIRKTFHFINGTEMVAEEVPITNNTSDIYNLWSIGILEGPTPFKLTAPKNISNPVISAKNVDDVEASYVADPFMIIDDGKYYVFFEVFNWETLQGDIGYAESNDGYNWEYKKIILDETFHLSYPYVFQWQNDYYLIPESNEDLSVRLYRAVSFPEKWEYLGNLLSGYHYSDPSIFQYDDKWWLFVTNTPDDGVMNLYYSNNLFENWMAHPLNPIVRYNKHIDRGAGRVIIYNDRPYRFTQDGYPDYGSQVFAFKITDLTEKTYAESIVSEEPIVTKSGYGWNAMGMHQLDLHKIGDKWIAVTDGKIK